MSDRQMIEKYIEYWKGWELDVDAHKQGFIGRGAQGSVYKIFKEDSSGKMEAAIKHIRIPTEEDIQNAKYDMVTDFKHYFKGQLERVENEIKAMKKFRGMTNIVSIDDYVVHDMFDEEENHWDIIIKMEYLQSFKDFFNSDPYNGEADEALVCKLGIDICNAFDLCEKGKTIHRDVKLSNIFVNKFGNFKLGDFGHAKALSESRGAQSRAGTDHYMAPEVHREESYDNTVDTYSLGVILYRLLNKNRLPFMPKYPNNIVSIDTMNATIKRMNTKTPAEMPYSAENELGKIAIKAMSFYPKDRFKSAKMLKRELEDYEVKFLVADVKEEIDDSQTDVGATVQKKVEPIEEDMTTSIFTPKPKQGEDVEDPIEEPEVDENNDEEAASVLAKYKKHIAIGMVALIVIVGAATLGLPKNTEDVQPIETPVTGDAVTPEMTEVSDKDVTTEDNDESENANDEEAKEEVAVVEELDGETLFANGMVALENEKLDDALVNFEKAKEAGSLQAYGMLGEMHYKGLGVEKDEAKGIEIFDEIIEQDAGMLSENDKDVILAIAHKQYKAKKYEDALKYFALAPEHVDAQYYQGLMYYNGLGVKRSYGTAVEWFAKASEQSHSMAQYYLGQCYYKGLGTKRSYKSAYSAFSKAANGNIRNAQYYMGLFYEKGYYVNKNSEKMFQWYKKAADKGHGTSQYETAQCYYDGTGTKRNMENAAKYYELAANKGNTSAQYKLGLMYFEGTGVDKDEAGAVKWFAKAAKANNANAQVFLAYCLEKGKGIDASMKDAYYWYEKAADNGVGKAQYMIGLQYSNGGYRDIDKSKAFKYLKLAAENNQVASQYLLGLCYLNGDGTSGDSNQAFQWFKKSAKNGDRKGQFALGNCYEAGVGTEPNIESAIYWYEKAAVQGDTKAKAKVEELKTTEE